MMPADIHPIDCRGACCEPWRTDRYQLTSLDKVCLQIIAGLPLGWSIAWTADHALQLLRAVF